MPQGILAAAFAFASSVATVVTVASAVINTVERVAGGGPAKPATATNQDRLFASVDPDCARKMAFGRTALATDVRYQAFTGSSQEYYHQIVCVAAHKVTSIEELWLDQERVWTSAGGVETKFSGYLTVTPILEGTSANAINIDGVWSAANGCRLTGCAYLYIRYKRTGATQDNQSPFSSTITNRMTIIGKAIPVYDPRRDTTVGGSGSMRADDQTTWAYSVSGDDIGRNAALCDLTHKLGWKIAGKLSVGCGVPPNRIDMAHYIAAANVCDESVALAAGGSEPRYRFDGLISEGDARSTAFDTFKSAANADLRDTGGRLAFDIIVNDLSSPRLDFDTGDVLGAFKWRPNTILSEDRNIGRGKYTDARSSALFQLVDYPAIRGTSPDGIERTLTLDLPAVQSPGQAQRLLKLKLQRLKYGGRFEANFNAKAWGVQRGDIVRLTFAPLGFVNKLFRVAETTIGFDGIVPLVLEEENAAIYTWSAEDAAPITLPTPTTYDYLNNPLIPSSLADIDPNAAVSLSIRSAYPKTGGTALFTVTSSAITIANHTWDYPDPVADCSRTGATISSLSASTTYFVYFDDATLTNTTPSYAVTTTYGDALNSTSHPYRHLVGYATTDASGGGGGGGGGTGGGGYGGGGGGGPIP